MHREVSMHESRPEQHHQLKLSEQSGTMGRILGYIYTSIYYSCKSFPVLLHDVMVGWWIASWVPMLYYVLLYCCSTAAQLLYRVMGG